MNNEAEFKKVFKQSVKAQHGYSMSLAAPMFSGIPDLYIIMPHFMPVLLEAKWLGEIKRDTFFRKIPFTEMQIHWIDQCHSVSPYSAMGLIGLKYKSIVYAALVAHGTPLFYSFTNSFLTDCSSVEYSNVSGRKLFDVEKLFTHVPIPKIATTRKNGQSELNPEYDINSPTLAL